MKYKLDGTFDITAPANVPGALLTNSNLRLVDSGASADVTLPATASLSVYQNLGNAWAVMADVTRTYWSALRSCESNSIRPGRSGGHAKSEERQSLFPRRDLQAERVLDPASGSRLGQITRF